MLAREFLLKFLLMGPQSGVQIVIVMWGLLVIRDFVEVPILTWLAKSLIYRYEIIFVLVISVPILIFLMDAMWYLLGKDKQALHDKMLGTCIIHVTP